MDVINIVAGRKDGAHKMLEIRTEIKMSDHFMVTSICNMAEVAQALGRPLYYTVQHFSFELHAQSRRGDESGTFEIRGAHTAAQLAQAANKFIKTYVECYSCGKPETEIVINEKPVSLTLVCGDCGSISEVDRRERLASLMVRKHFLEAKKGINAHE